MDVIAIFWGGLYNQSPGLSILGGITCSETHIKNYLKENGHDIDITTPFIQVLAEECFDYWLDIQQFSKNYPAQYLNQHQNLLAKIEESIQAHAKIANKILANQPLTVKQKALWKQLTAVANHIYHATRITPIRLFLETPENMQPGYLFSYKRHDIDFPIIFIKFLNKHEAPYYDKKHYPDRRLGSWQTTTTKKEKLSPQDISSFYLSLEELNHSMYKTLRDEYINVGLFKELLGKLFVNYQLLPGYIETFFPDLHQVYLTLYQSSSDINDFFIYPSRCSDEGCMKLCVAQEMTEINLLLPSLLFISSKLTPTIAQIAPHAAPISSTKQINPSQIDNAYLSTDFAASNIMLYFTLATLITHGSQALISNAAYLFNLAKKPKQEMQQNLDKHSDSYRDHLKEIQEKSRNYSRSFPNSDKWFHFFIIDLNEDIENELSTNSSISLATVKHYQLRLDNLTNDFIFHKKTDKKKFTKYFSKKLSDLLPLVLS